MATTCDLPTYNLCIQEGTDYRIVFSILDDDGLPVDLTGATAELRIKFLTSILNVVGSVNGNSITFNIDETQVYDGLCGTYQADYTLGATTTRILRGDVDVERKV